MRSVTSVAVAALTVFAGMRDAEARKVEAEPSHFGKFALTFDTAKQTCTVSLQRGAAPPVALFAANACTPDLSPVSGVSSAERVGSQPLPVSRKGEEFHLFSIAAARGGNAVGGAEYWAVVVTEGGQWTTPGLFEGTFIVARLVGDEKTTLVLDDPATTTSDGARVAISFGKSSTFTLPKLPSWPVSKESRPFEEVLLAPSHASNEKHGIEEGNSALILDDDGPCALKSLEEKKVRLAVEVTTWDDGRTTTKCLSVKTVP